ncbi:heat shock cognate 70 kDa protein-like protein [Tanacetum coccineum]
MVYGSSVLATNLSGYGIKKVKDLRRLDVTHLSLCLRIYGDVMNVMMPRNTPIHAIKEHVYVTAIDNHVIMVVDVYHDESPVFLDSITFCSIPATPAGEQKIKVFFNVDINDKNQGQKRHFSVEILLFLSDWAI